MGQLREILTTRQIPGALHRRWFTSGSMDLYVWCNQFGSPVWFQLTYDKGIAERTITWKSGLGFLHAGLDDGERRDGRYKASQMLVADGQPDIEHIVGLVHEVGLELPFELKSWLLAKICEFPLVHQSDTQQPLPP